VAINMLDYVTDLTIVDFILLRRLIKHRRWNCTKYIYIKKKNGEKIFAIFKIR